MSGTDNLSTRPMDNTSDAPSRNAPDAIHPDVDRTHVKGVDPTRTALAADHPDAVKLRVADQSDCTSVGHDASSPAVLEDGHAGSWSSAKLARGEE